MIRAALIAAVVVVAVVVSPAAMVPGTNSADLILWLAPLTVLYIGIKPARRSRRHDQGRSVR